MVYDCFIFFNELDCLASILEFSLKHNLLIIHLKGFSVSLLKRENGCRRKCDTHNCVKAAGGRFSQADGGMGWQYATSSFC